jgi:hypothetical protein
VRISLSVPRTDDQPQRHSCRRTSGFWPSSAPPRLTRRMSRLPPSLARRRTRTRRWWASRSGGPSVRFVPSSPAWGWAAWMAAVLLDRNVQRLECSCHYPPDALNTYCISWSSRGRCDRTTGHGAYASSSGATTSSASVTFPSSSSGGQAHGLFTHGCPGFRLLAAWSFQLVRDPIYEAVI